MSGDIRRRLPVSPAVIPRVGVITVALAAAVFMAVCDNLSLWRALWLIVTPLTVDGVRILATSFLIVVLLFTLLLMFFGMRYLFRPVLAIILITAAVVGYFMATYGVVIDRAMIQNVFETDVREATELLGPGLFWHVLVFGAVPAWLVFRLPIRYDPFWRGLGKRCLVLGAGLLLGGAAVFASYKDLALIMRQNRQLRMLVNPTYPAYALATYARRSLAGHSETPLRPLTGAVVQDPSWQKRGRKRVIVFILGETARAANFSLNGYARETNPELTRYDVINFREVSACATSTADAVPCLFSGMSRANCSSDKARQSENLLDLLNRAGIRVLWRDNNSGSKSVADRVAYEDLANSRVAGLCRDGECFDEILLHDLQEAIDRADGDLFLVLHQKGSHGPLYYRRVPDAFRKFTPECRQDEVQTCSREEITNSYDNTILYTDHFLAQTIDFLQSNARAYDTALLYMSDHGESLGENGIYLHGAPYFLAPEEQTHVPCIVWLSEGFTRDAGLDLLRLRQTTAQAYSHDNLFHTILGMFDVKTNVYRAEFDLFAPGRGVRPERSCAPGAASG